MTSRTPLEYVKTHKHLPDFLRDFHDQKDVFKFIHSRYAKEDETLTWRDAHCYTVDWFLWFMGQCGYTLQRSRANVQFRDIQEEITAFKKEQSDAFAQWLKERNPDVEPS